MLSTTRLLPGPLAHASLGSVHDAAVADRALAPVLASPRRSNLPVGLHTDVDATVARPACLSVASAGPVQNDFGPFSEIKTNNRNMS